MAPSCTRSYLQSSCHGGILTDRSGRTFSSDLLPSLGATINRSMKLRRFIISPYDHRYRAWQLFMIPLVIYSAWICPFELAFLRYLPETLFLAESIVNSFFAIDIVLTFFVAYLNRKSHLLVDDPKKIAVRYISSWFIFDACSTVPFQPLSLLFTKHRNSLCFNILSMLRLWRLRRVSSLIGNMTNLVVHGTSRTRNFRDTVKAASEFAARNQLPDDIKNQMLSHICLRFKTEGLRQQETLNDLPNGIHSSIAHHLFFPIVQKVYLFNGVSTDFLFLLVTQMQAEYVPPKEDIILQNEAPTDLYILVSGAVDLRVHVNGIEQIHGRASAGEMFGEFGVLYYRPQPYTVRTRELSQILRLSRTTIMDAIRANVEDGNIVMNNLLKNIRLQESSSKEVLHKDAELTLRECPYGKDKRGNQSTSIPCQEDHQLQRLPTQESVDTEALLHTVTEKNNRNTVSDLLRPGDDISSMDADGQTALYAAFLKGNNKIIKLLLAQGARVDKSDTKRWTPMAIADEEGKQTMYSLLASHENRTKRKENHHVESIDNINRFSETSIRRGQSPDFRNAKLSETVTFSEGCRHSVDNHSNKRVTIYVRSHKSEGLKEQMRKLINLPASLEELLRVGGQKFADHHPTKVVNHENAEIDDISIVRDGDHLFLLEM